MRAGGCAGSGESICRPDGGASPVPATTTHFVVSDFTLQGAEPLIRYMLGQPFEVEPPIGRLPILEAREPGIGEPVAPLRVFLSHTAELDEHPADGSFVAAAQRAVIRAGNLCVDVTYFGGGEERAVAVSRQVEQMSVYVGVIGFRYGSPVADQPNVSYTELEFDTATARGLPRLVFLVDEEPTVPLPRTFFVDPQFGDRQDRFRDRLMSAGVIVQRVASPQQLELRLYHALTDLRRDAQVLVAQGTNRVPAQARRQCRIFLCHSSSDKPAVRVLYHRLRDAGFQPWPDEENILPGQDWEGEISSAVRAADLVIVSLSQGSIGKAGYLQREIRMVLDVADQQPEGRIFLIPARLEECDVPDRLRRWQWVDLFEPHGYGRLLGALRSVAKTLELPATVQDLNASQLAAPRRFPHGAHF